MASVVEPILYSYFRSSSSWRVRLALSIKQIPYQYRAVNLLQAANTKPEYELLNPMKTVPTLEIDGYTLGESVAIIEYLEETRPDIALLPKDPALRAQVRQFVQTINSGIQPLQNLRILKYFAKDPKQKSEWLTDHLSHGFRALEAQLQASAGKYCFGDTLSMADCYLVPQLYSLRRFEIDETPYPVCVRVDAELAKLPAFQAAHAHNQPDTPNPIPK